MILYFADRTMQILGHASTELPDGLMIMEDLKTEEVENGTATFECKIPYNTENRAKVEACTEAGNYLLRSHNGENEFYTIIETEGDTKNQTIYIYAEDAGMDLLNEVVTAYAADKAYPISHYINRFASDTGFVIGINEVEDLTRKLSWEGEDTSAARIASAARQFDGCEVSYSFDVKGLEITNKYINIYKERGKNAGIQLRLNRDIDRIITKKSVADLATSLQVTGGIPEGEDKPITLQGYEYDDGDFYVVGTRLNSREALKRWSRYVWAKEPNQKLGYTGHIIKQYSYDTTSQKELCAHAVTELKTICDTAVNYEVDINVLPDNIEIGDWVDIVDDDGALYLSARILEMTTSACDQKQTATLGEYLIRDSGISQKVEELAKGFSDLILSSGRAEQIAESASDKAEAAQDAADNAADIAVSADEKAQSAIDNAADAADKANEASDLANQAKEEASEAINAANSASQNATEAKEQAANAASSAQTAREEAAAAQEAVVGANAEVEKINQEITTVKGEINTALDDLADQAAEIEATKETMELNYAKKTDVETVEANLTTEISKKVGELQTTVEQNYAAKTEVIDLEGRLQSQITQNAEGLTSAASKMERLESDTAEAVENVNTALDKADAAQTAAGNAQTVADAAQAAADQAKADAATASTKADAAQSTADAAEAAVNAAGEELADAKTDLEEAKQNLANVTNRVDATEEDIAAAQAAVDAAEENVNKALADVAEAQAAADAAQTAADQAKTDAEEAQAAATTAQQKADNAQAVADKAQSDALKAQEDVAALTKRVTTAETNITQNAEQIALTAQKTDEIGDKLINDYYSKAQTDAAIEVAADEISVEVSSINEKLVGDYYTKEQTDAAIQLEAEGIKSTVSTVKETAESAQESADGAYDLAAENESQISETRSEVEQLSDALSTLIVGEDGETMMEQTDDGWRFNMSPLLSQLEDARNDLDGQRAEIDGIDTTISNLDSLINDITKKTAYITMSTDDKGNPCIELGKQDSPFKLRITNESIDFVQDGVKIAYITNRQLYIQSSVVTDEMKVGAGSGFIWKKRQNGNMGLRWIEGS